MRNIIITTIILFVSIVSAAQSTLHDSVIFARDYISARIMLTYVAQNIGNDEVEIGKFNNIKYQLMANSLSKPVCNQTLCRILNEFEPNKWTGKFLPWVSFYEFSHITNKKGAAIEIVNSIFSINCKVTKNTKCRNMRDSFLLELNTYFDDNSIVYDSIIKKKVKKIFVDSIMLDSFRRVLESEDKMISTQVFLYNSENKKNNDLESELKFTKIELNNKRIQLILLIIIMFFLFLAAIYLGYVVYKKNKKFNELFKRYASLAFPPED